MQAHANKVTVFVSAKTGYKRAVELKQQGQNWRFQRNANNDKPVVSSLPKPFPMAVLLRKMSRQAKVRAANSQFTAGM